jgi:hypothetical protein
LLPNDVFWHGHGEFVLLWYVLRRWICHASYRASVRVSCATRNARFSKSGKWRAACHSLALIREGKGCCRLRAKSHRWLQYIETLVAWRINIVGKYEQNSQKKNEKKKNRVSWLAYFEQTLMLSFPRRVCNERGS